MLRYLSILALFIVGCDTRQRVPSSAESVNTDTSIVAIKADVVDAYPEFSVRTESTPKHKPNREELLNHRLSLYQSLQGLGRGDAFGARILNDKDTLLSLPKGTRLLIPANAFRTGHENAIIVNVTVREYYAMADIIAENLTTTTEDNILETGGMIHITATSNGEECVLNNGKEIQISFPATSPKPGMQLFTGTRDSLSRIVWVPSPADETELEGSEGIFFSGVEEMPEFPGGYDALMKHINKNLKYPADARRLCVEGVVFVQFVVDRTGSVVNLSVLRGLHRSLDRAATDAIPTLPKWTPGRINGKVVDVRMVFPIRFSLDGSGLAMRSNAPNPYTDEQVRNFEENMTDSTLKKTDTDEVSYYILKTAKLGWINCDRFIDAKERTTFKVYIADASKNEVDVKLIFKNIRSILPGNRIDNFFYFPNVPENEQAELLALYVSNSGLEMGNKKVIISSDHTDSLLFFQPVTVAKLKGYLETLDNN